MHAALQHLLKHPRLWRGDAMASADWPVLPSGHPELDAMLPGGGWPVHGLNEILTDQHGIGELSLVLPACASLVQEQRWLVWVGPPHQPYAPALLEYGMDVSRTVILNPPSSQDRWWAVEQALRSGASAAVLAWLPHVSEQVLRRLQLAAEAGQTTAFLFRPLADRARPSPAAVRLALHADPVHLTVDVLKRRGAGPARLLLERHDALARHTLARFGHELAGAGRLQA